MLERAVSPEKVFPLDFIRGFFFPARLFPGSDCELSRRCGTGRWLYGSISEKRWIGRLAASSKSIVTLLLQLLAALPGYPQ
jgi:hypothetical protein